jgi:hypothetical protein
MKTATNQTEAINNRKQTLPIKVFCNPDEKQAITNSAYRCGMSVSHYLRAVALGKSNTPIRNLRLTDELIKTKVELGSDSRVTKIVPKPSRNHPLGQQGILQGNRIQPYPRNRG